MSEGFPLLTTKKMYWKGIVTELMWFLRGDTNIKFLVDNGVHIWTGDAYKNYGKRMVDIINVVIPAEFMDKGWVKLDNHGEYGVLSKEEFINKIKTDFKFAEKWGDLGPVYGKQWRNWDIKPDIETKSYIHKRETHFTFDINERPSIDQIANLIHDLKTNPDSRRLMVTSWNVGGTTGQYPVPNQNIDEASGIYFDNYEMAHFRLLTDVNYLPYGRSYIHFPQVSVGLISNIFPKSKVLTLI